MNSDPIDYNVLPPPRLTRTLGSLPVSSSVAAMYEDPKPKEGQEWMVKSSLLRYTGLIKIRKIITLGRLLLSYGNEKKIGVAHVVSNTFWSQEILEIELLPEEKNTPPDFIKVYYVPLSEWKKSKDERYLKRQAGGHPTRKRKQRR